MSWDKILGGLAGATVGLISGAGAGALGGALTGAVGAEVLKNAGLEGYNTLETVQAGAVGEGITSAVTGAGVGALIGYHAVEHHSKHPEHSWRQSVSAAAKLPHITGLHCAIFGTNVVAGGAAGTAILKISMAYDKTWSALISGGTIVTTSYALTKLFCHYLTESIQGFKNYLNNQNTNNDNPHNPGAGAVEVVVASSNRGGRRLGG